MGLNFSFFSKFSFLIHCYGQENTKTHNQEKKTAKFHTTIHQVAGPLLHNCDPKHCFYWGGQFLGQERGSTCALTSGVLPSDL